LFEPSRSSPSSAEAVELVLFRSSPSSAEVAELVLFRSWLASAEAAELVLFRSSPSSAEAAEQVLFRWPSTRKNLRGWLLLFLGPLLQLKRAWPERLPMKYGT
jgi:hypothetical protein